MTESLRNLESVDRKILELGQRVIKRTNKFQTMDDSDLVYVLIVWYLLSRSTKKTQRAVLTDKTPILFPE